MRDYREKDVKGMMVQNNRIYPVMVTVRMTSDKVGQTMSFTAGNKSYKAVAEVNTKAREQHMSYGQYVASEWAKEHVRVRRPKEESHD